MISPTFDFSSLNSILSSPYMGCVQQNEDESNKKEEEKSEFNLKPIQIKERLNEYVIGQEEAKKYLSVAAYNHYKRMKIKTKTEIKRSNIMLIGNTGTGKTYLVETLAKILEVPVLILDATEYTQTGVVGKEVNDIPNLLIKKAEGDKEKAQYGIVYIDEVDKLGKNHLGNGTNRGNEIQSCFLKLLDGCDMESSTMRTMSSMMGMFGGSSGGYSGFNTKNVLFICGGAFSGIDEVMNKNDSRCTIGFGRIEDRKPMVEDAKDITTQDIIKYGLMPEFVGRFPVIAKLNPLSVEDLVKILVEPKNSIINQYKELFAYENIDFDVTENALKTIAQLALGYNTGARALNGILEKLMTEIVFNLPIEKTDERLKFVIEENNIKNFIVPQLMKCCI